MRITSLAFTAILALCGLASFSGGCTGSGASSSTGFGRSYESINTGATQAQVRAALGKPNQHFTARVGTSVTTDPQNKLGPAFPNGTPYDVWYYRRGGTLYRLYFSAAPGTPPADWRLVARDAESTNAANP